MTPPAGTPCFLDLSTADVDAAVQFYQRLLGWTPREEETEERYVSLLLGDEPAAGAFTGSEPTPTGWITYLAAPDGDVEAQVRTAGGELVAGPLKVGDGVTVWHLRAPGGASFGLWRCDDDFPFARERGGAFTYAELFTGDGPAADLFFAAVFGISGAQIGGGSDFDYTYWSTGWGRFGGRDQEFWSVYFQVPEDTSLDDCVQQAKELGATISDGPADSPYGRLARVIDPQGNPFTLIDRTVTVEEDD